MKKYKTLSDMSDQEKITHIKESVCKFYGTNIAIMNLLSRKKEVVRVKHHAMFLIYKNVKTTFNAICKDFNYSNHTTVLHAVNKIDTPYKLP